MPSPLKLSAQQEADLKQIRDWEAQIVELRNDKSDTGRQAFAIIAAKLRNLTHDQQHPNEECTIIDVPQAPDGSFFTLNEKPYFGEVTVPACVGHQLLQMIDAARRVDAARMADQGRNIAGGEIGRIAARINAEP